MPDLEYLGENFAEGVQTRRVPNHTSVAATPSDDARPAVQLSAATPKFRRDSVHRYQRSARLSRSDTDVPTWNTAEAGRTQLVDLQRRADDLCSQGIGLAVVTYDTREVLKRFADEHGISCPLLCDPGSAIIRSHGV